MRAVTFAAARPLAEGAQRESTPHLESARLVWVHFLDCKRTDLLESRNPEHRKRIKEDLEKIIEAEFEIATNPETKEKKSSITQIGDKPDHGYSGEWTLLASGCWVHTYPEKKYRSRATVGIEVCNNAQKVENVLNGIGGYYGARTRLDLVDENVALGEDKDSREKPFIVPVQPS